MLFATLLGVAVAAGSVTIQVLGIVLLAWAEEALARRIQRWPPMWRGLLLLEVASLFLIAAFLVQIALWAGLFVLVGEFSSYHLAFYHSAVNFTTLGYGDVVMNDPWKVLGPLEAVAGILSGGLAAAVLFAVLRVISGRAPAGNADG